MATNNAANNATAATGKVLQGQGVGTASAFSTATYPATATGTGTILRADGTNWVATTATFPTTAGSSGNVLTSDGTNWNSSTPLTSGWIKLQTQTVSGATNLSFTSTYLTATYSTYVLVVSNCTVSAGSTLSMTLSTDNGSTHLSTGYLSGNWYLQYNTATVANQNRTTGITLFTGASSSVPSAGTYWLYNFVTANPPSVQGDSVSGGNIYWQKTVGYNTTTGSVNNFLLQFDTGNVSGTFTLYGIAQ